MKDPEIILRNAANILRSLGQDTTYPQIPELYASALEAIAQNYEILPCTIWPPSVSSLPALSRLHRDPAGLNPSPTDHQHESSPAAFLATPAALAPLLPPRDRERAFNAALPSQHHSRRFRNGGCRFRRWNQLLSAFGRRGGADD